jgi:DNA-binding response OmpR family regulator
MDGYRLCHEIRHREALKHLPFIHYTSTYTTPDDEQLSKTVGADGYLTKPAPAEVLLRALANATHRAGGNTPLSSNDSGTAFVMKEYSVALVKKLEEKNNDLERAMVELREAHKALVELNESLERRVQERTAELEASNHKLQAALAEVKELSGLLPICSWCKKIRDGEEYWHRVEDYICQRTKAEFSHSICPECFGKQSPHRQKS